MRGLVRYFFNRERAGRALDMYFGDAARGAAERAKRAGRAARDRYFSDWASGIENLGNDARYVVLPVALGALLRSSYDNSVPDEMVTQSLANPAYAFGAAEALRSAGYFIREWRDKTLTLPKIAGAVFRAWMPFSLAGSVADGSENIRQALDEMFTPMAVWGVAHATGTKHKNEAKRE